MKKKQILKWVVLAVAIAINLFILINAFINGETSAKESNTIAHTVEEVINAIKPETITPENFDKFALDLRKLVGHYGLFVVSGGFSTWALYLFAKDTKIGYFLWQFLMTTGFGILIALISELAQIFVEGRTGAWVDVGIDVGGYFTGVFLVFLIFLLLKSPIFNREKYMKNQAE